MAANQTGLRFLKTLKNMRLRGSSRATYAQASKSGRLYILNAFALVLLNYRWLNLYACGNEIFPQKAFS